MIRAILVSALLALTPALEAAEPLDLDALLEQVRQGRAKDNTENRRRVAEFERERAQQAERLDKIQAERASLEQRAAELEQAFADNEAQLAAARQRLDERLGGLKELFGVLQATAGELAGQFDSSLTRLQFPDRGAFLSKTAQALGRSSRLIEMTELERLWFELQNELVASGRVVRFPHPVTAVDGTERQVTLVRVGLFNIVSTAGYLDFEPDTGRVSELPRQPAARFTTTARALASADAGVVPFGIDASRGHILSRLIRKPTLRERIDQGGVIGYVIIGLGALAAVIALYRLVALIVTNTRVNRQARRPDQPSDDNALGRVLAVYHANPDANVEAMELRLGEAVLKETPSFNRLSMLLKVIAVAAPLLGLLGTVAGMIEVFQSITLFGSGDPQIMAGGISQALVTTVLGLCVAIPTVFLHAVITGRARHLTQVLEQQAVGLVAEQAERIGDGAVQLEGGRV